MVFSTGIAKAKTYNVEKVEIIEPYDLDFKKEIVIDKAFKSAFEILISRIINSDNIKSIDFNNIDEIRAMVDSFLIQNEKFIGNNYIAEFNILFNRKDILTFLDEGNYKTLDANIQNTVMQIIVDTFDELEWSMNTNGNVELKNK